MRVNYINNEKITKKMWKDAAATAVRKLWKCNAQFMRETYITELWEKMVSEIMVVYDYYADDRIRSKEYTVNECLKLIDQIVKGDNSLKSLHELTYTEYKELNPASEPIRIK
jgi:hypothetical protein